MSANQDHILFVFVFNAQIIKVVLKVIPFPLLYVLQYEFSIQKAVSSLFQSFGLVSFVCLLNLLLA